MDSELIIDSTPNEVHIALLEDKRLVEFNSEKDNNFSVGDIYLGRIRKIMPGLNAAFVDIGYEKDAFLHYLDLGPQFNTLVKYMKNVAAGKQIDSLLNNYDLEQDIDKGGKISSILGANQWIPVQVAKEPISTKGPRISCDISLAGRYVVMVPFSNIVSVSQKIKSSEERNRLKRLAQSIKPRNFGLIVRTVAEGKKVAEIDEDIQDLLSKWNQFYELLKTAKPPQKLLGEMDRTSTILRDMLNSGFNNIHVNDQAFFEEVKAYIRNIAPEQEEIVKLYKGKMPLFEHLGIDKQIKTVFGKTVNLQNGAYLIIEHTEALHVIDVNSGGRSKSGADQEKNALQVNMMAATEIARQLRLRDMGGIIVIDFIDMHSAIHKKELFECVRTEMKKDRAKHTILPPSKFGLIQITRQRVRPETKIITVEKCPACDGTGEIKASILLVDDIKNNMRYILTEQNEKTVSVKVHPYLEAYLTKGWFFSSIRHKWQKEFKKKIKIEGVTAYHLMEFHFFNNSGEEIKL
ncbi:MAG: Rne/Rng family ribonuclease [Bacteroidetes bacterium]|nr:Rne/Rng family ribonuclease [Bacteroidota bacterium]